MRRLFLLLVTSFLLNSVATYAFDIVYYDNENPDNDTLYFNILSSDDVNGYEVEVTYGDVGRETSYYSGAITLPDSVDYMGHFYQVSTIGDDAFRDAHTMTHIYIPKTVVSIQTFPFGAFDNCSSLSTITVAADNPVYDSRIYSGTSECNAIIETATNTLIVGSIGTRIPNTVTKIGPCAFMNRTDGHLILHTMDGITIPNSVVEIGQEAFAGCVLMNSIHIGSGLTTLGDNVFAGCPAMQTIEVDEQNTHFINLDGALVSKDITEFVYVPAAQGGVYRIPEGVTAISSGAFSASRLRFISLPKSVKHIGNDAFDGCAADSIVCRPLVPPTDKYGNYPSLGGSTAVLCVPGEAIEDYKAISAYTSAFSDIIGFSEVTEVSETTASLKWLRDTAVVHYDIDVYLQTTLVAHYEVDGQGHLITNPSSSIHRMKKDTTISSTDYFVLTINDLNANTSYNYTIIGKNVENILIYNESGSFRTTCTQITGFSDSAAEEPKKVYKILRDGKLFILRGDKVYTATGQELR